MLTRGRRNATAPNQDQAGETVCDISNQECSVSCRHTSGQQSPNVIVQVNNDGSALPCTYLSQTSSGSSIATEITNLTITGQLFARDLTLLLLHFGTPALTHIKVSGLIDPDFNLDLIHNLTSLKHIDISHNAISRILPSEKCTETVFPIVKQECRFPPGTQITTLLVNDNVLSDMPKGVLALFPNLLTLDWSRNQLNALPTHTLEVTPHLRTLWLRGNAISALHKDMFAPLTHLRELNIGANLITSVHELAFHSLGALTFLAFVNNPITHLAPNTFSTLSALERLFLDDLQLTTLHENLFTSNPNLTIAGFDRNLITRVPRHTLSGLSKLQELRLDDNQLTTLSMDLTSLSNLRFFYIRRNKITSIAPDALQHLTSLKRLALSGNPLRTVPPNIFDNMEALEIVTLHDCGLSSLPHDLFTSNGKLEQLFLANNWLSAFSQASPLERLTVLDLTGNPLKDMPSPAAFPNIHSLRLSGHVMGTVDLTTVITLPHLKNLELSASASLATPAIAVFGFHELDACTKAVDFASATPEERVAHVATCLSDHKLVLQADAVRNCTAPVIDTAPPGSNLGALVVECIHDKLLKNAERLRSLDLRNVALTSHLADLQPAMDHLHLSTFAVGWPEMSENTLPFAHVCRVLGQQVRQFMVTNTAYTSFVMCEDKHFDSVFLTNNRRLTSLHLFQPVRQLDVRGCHQLKNLALPGAEILDLSYTKVPGSTQLCKQWGSRVLVYHGIESSDMAALVPDLVERCIESVELVDFSNSTGIHRLFELNRALAAPVVLAGSGRFWSSDYGTLTKRDTAPQLVLLNSPIQCRLQMSQVRAQRTVHDEPQPVPELQLAFSFECSCSNGYHRAGRECVRDPERGHIIALISLFAGVVALAAGYSGWQWWRRVIDRRQAAQREQRLQALESSWKIDYEDLYLIGMIGTGAYGRVMKADWDGLVVAVKELHAAARVFDRSSEEEFQRESEFLQKTRHPNVVRFFGSGHKPDDGAPFMVLEYIPLGSLFDFLRPKEGSLQAWVDRWRSQEEASDDFVVVTRDADGGLTSFSPSGEPLTRPLLGADRAGDVELAVLGPSTPESASNGAGSSVCPATAWELKLRLARDVACGMSFIHSLGKVHRLVRVCKGGV